MSEKYGNPLFKHINKVKESSEAIPAKGGTSLFTCIQQQQ